MRTLIVGACATAVALTVYALLQYASPVVDVAQMSQAAHAIRVSMHDCVLTPSEIAVRRNESVMLELVSDDVVVLVGIEQLEARTTVTPGIVSTLLIPTATARRHKILCRRESGNRAELIAGWVTVEP